MLFNALGFLSLVSPPFLAFFVWKKSLQTPGREKSARWKHAVDWASINFDCLMVDMMP